MMAARRSAAQVKKLRALRRALIWPYAAAALLLLPLALVRRWDSRVTADVTVSRLSFDFVGSSAGVLVDSRPYQSAYVARSVTAELRNTGAIVSLKIAPEGSLTIDRPRLDSLQIGPNAHVTLARSDLTSLAVTVARGAAAAQLTLPAQASLECEYCEVDGVTHERYQKVLAGDDGILTLRSTDSPFHLVLTTDGASALAEDLQIANPKFVDESGVIADGKVTLRDVPGIEIGLIKGDLLAFSEPHDFRITRIEALPEGLHVVMTGWAREVRSGTVASSENRLPSLLHRLHANQALALYFTAVIFVAGTALNVLRQLRVVSAPK